MDEAQWDGWIEAIRTDGMNLTSWEQDFVDLVEDQRAEGRRLSERQAEILERIYCERTP